MRKEKCWYFIPSILLMGLIFYFSAEDAVSSASSSENTVLWFVRLFRITDPESLASNNELYSFLNFCIRKGAHFFLYTALGFCLSFGYTAFAALSATRQMLCAMLTGVIYAVCDEVHQYFVPGRACQLRDVCIDTVGVLIGAAFFHLIHRLWKRHRR